VEVWRVLTAPELAYKVDPVRVEYPMAPDWRVEPARVEYPMAPDWRVEVVTVLVLTFVAVMEEPDIVEKLRDAMLKVLLRENVLAVKLLRLRLFVHNCLPFVLTVKI